MKELATGIVRRLREAGHPAYFAGGWVRDYLLGYKELGDIDIATSARPEEVVALFSHTHEVGAQFGVVIVVEGGHAFEVASFRKDGLYIDGRRPEEIEYATAQEDAQRRDCTINGMFYDPLTEEVIDYVGGQNDLSKGVVRAIGDARARFGEDRLRLLRVIRVACRFGFELDDATSKAVCEYASDIFPAVAVERVWQELQKMAKHPGFHRALGMLWSHHLLTVLFPELEYTSDELLQERIDSVDQCGVSVPMILRLCLLFGDMSRRDLLKILERYKASRAEARLVEQLCEGRKLCRSKTVEPLIWVRFYALESSESLLDVLAAERVEGGAFLTHHRQRQEALASHISRAQSRHYLLDAAALQHAGVTPGPILGKLLEEGERLAVAADLSTPEEVMEKLRQSPLWLGGNCGGN